ncbi:MAG: sigma-54-dependent Fis family transcriptional regulator [Deltaproteobacteria bacterium]|nr:MAG: sigma-54-dependent Fis family transcriptional regulator [Deltaproteobacteria bacterium]
MTAHGRILVADDERNLRRVLSAILQRDGYEVVEATDGAEALERLDSDIDVVITDLKMPRVDGMEVLEQVTRREPGTPVIMITAFGTVDNAVASVKAGAFDYIEKPFDQDQIRQIVAKAVKQSAANRRALRAIAEEGEARGRFGLVGDSPEMRDIYDVIEKVADTPSTVLITGESGTGKELVARALHEHSARRDKPFIRINCAAIPKTLMESELFGYEKGAFTGATNSKPGRFELADGGTLFLDEIGEIPVEMQVKLLRAIQESEFERVGGIKTLKVDVRLVTATNRDLEQEVRAGTFREDLYYRLNVVPIRIPPLRERKSDIPLLVDHIIRKFNLRLKKDIAGISDAALARLQEHSWPGNIRELENVLERTLLFCKGATIDVTDLPEELGDAPATGDRIASERRPAVAAGDPIASGQPASLKDIVRAETTRVEKELIARALDETGGNVTQAAKLLKISRKSLQMKMKEFGLRDREAPDPPAKS